MYEMAMSMKKRLRMTTFVMMAIVFQVYISVTDIFKKPCL